MSAHDPLLARIMGEFHEMPGLRLTVGQASRFWQLEPSVCEAALRMLVQREVLYRTLDGYYIGHPQARQGKAAFPKRES